MPNRFGRQIPVADFNPKGILPDGLLPVARSTGEAAAGLSQAADHLADTLGRIADEKAVLEGKDAGKVAGLDPAFRPTGDTSLRGRAYEETATKTYLDNLDAKLRTDLQTLYEANKGSPAKLKASFDALGKQYEREHVFEQIHGDFRASFTRLRLPYENKALSDLESDQRDQGRAALIENITASQTNAARAAAADPANPDTAKVVASELARMDALIDEAVAADTLPAATAAVLKQKNRTEVTVRAAIAQAEALGSADAVGAYRANAKKQFAAGAFKGLDAAGYDELDSKLEQLQRQKRVGAGHAETLLDKNVGDFVQRAVDGFPVSNDEWTRFSASEGASSPQGQAILARGHAQLQIASVLRNRSIADGEQLVSTMRAELNKGGAASEGQADLVRFAEKVVKEQRTALNADPLGLAERKRVVAAVAPIDFQGFMASDNPAAVAELAAQVRSRTAQARAVASEFQRAPVFLRPEEKARLADIVAAGGDKALALAGAVVKGADIDAPAVLAEISGDAPLLAQAGAIIAEGGNVQAARDAFAASAAKAATGKALPGLDQVKAGAASRATFGTAYLLQPDDAGRVKNAADAITRTRIERAGVDPKSSDAETIYRRALQEAAGAVFVDGTQFGGVADYKPGYWTSYKVPVPAGVRADAFRDVVRSLNDADLAGLKVPPQAADGRPFTARDIAGGVPVAVRGGYRFAMGDPLSGDPKWIRGADGRAFVLPFDQLAPTLRARVPGAFLGGR